MPRFLFTSMVFGYDSLTLLLASLFLWVAIRVTRGYHPRWGFWILGGLAGLALLTKYLTTLLPLEIILLAFSRGAGGAKQRSRGENLISPLHLRTFAPLLRLGQAALAFLLVTGWWFGYLFINFNEIDTYGPVLGTLAPLLRGDGSDRTVEQLFAWVSRGQASPPAHIDQQSYTPWQIITEFFITFWGNPIIRPYPLNWFVGLMTVTTIVAGVGLIKWWRTLLASSSASRRFLASLLLLHCLLPLPFMVIRLFGARDALEAVQGRHLLFLSGPAIAILLVWGIVNIRGQGSGVRSHVSRFTFHVSRLPLPVILGLLLTGSISQLIYMKQVYPLLLPVQTIPYAGQVVSISADITLDGGARLVDYEVTPVFDADTWFSRLLTVAAPSALKVSLIWQGGAEPTAQDYKTELALVDAQGNIRASWLAYQTQARYPTRAWEAGDTIRDEGWLPLIGLPAGNYELRWRILGEAEPILDWQILTTYSLPEAVNLPSTTGWLLWRDGIVPSRPPLLSERETAQFTLPNLHAKRPISTQSVQSPTPNPQLTGPDGLPRPPASTGPTWANFIIGSDWPPGDYRLQPDGVVALKVAENKRNFQPPPMTHPLEVNFENQMKLLGYDLPTRRVQPGSGLPLTLYWQGLQWMGENFVIFDRLLDNQGIAWGGYDRLAKEDYSTLLWAPSEVVADGFAVPVAPDAPDGVYHLSLGWYRRINGEAQSLLIFNLETGEATGATAITIGPIKVGGPPPGVTVAEAAPQTEMNVVLGEQIKLLGFDLASQQISKPVNSSSRFAALEVQPGPKTESSLASRRPLRVARFASSLRLTVYWQALSPTETDYTVFAHVRNSAKEKVAQQDSPPVGGVYPTSLWDPGEIIKDELEIPLNQLQPGTYDLVIGMYDFTTGLRLPIAGSPDGTILLQTFEVDE